jgi:uncharacterized protein YijF (DUF1287 family)
MMMRSDLTYFWELMKKSREKSIKIKQIKGETMWNKYKLLQTDFQEAQRKIEQLESFITRTSSNLTQTAQSQLKMNSIFLERLSKIENKIGEK